MFGTGSILDQFAALSAFLATVIALGGFVGHAVPALRGDDERAVRRTTAMGGIGGLAVAVFVIVLSAGTG